MGLASLLSVGCTAIPVDGVFVNRSSKALQQIENAVVMSPSERWAPVRAAQAPFCPGIADDTRSVVVPRLERPALGVPFDDPVFGARVQRITAARPGEVFKPAYSTVQAWNADESLLLLYRGGLDPAHVLLDGRTYAFISELDIDPSDVEEVWWSHADPRALHYVSKARQHFGHLRRLDVSTGRATTLVDLSGECGQALPTGGGDVQMPSHDDDLFGFRCRDSGGDTRMLTWRASTDELTVQPLGKGTPWDPWTAPAPSPRGDAVWLQGRVLETDLRTERLRHDVHKASEHASIGLAGDGGAALFATAFDPSPGGCDGDPADGVGHLVMHRFDDGSCRSLVNEAAGYPYTTSGTHVSALASGRPGRVAMSSVGYGRLGLLDDTRAAPALFSEIYLVDAGTPQTGGARVCRLTHHRSHGKSARNAAYQPYFGEPHVTISPSGTRVLFGSDWHDSGAVDSYVIELPGDAGG